MARRPLTLEEILKNDPDTWSDEEEDVVFAEASACARRRHPSPSPGTAPSGSWVCRDKLAELPQNSRIFKLRHPPNGDA